MNSISLFYPSLPSLDVETYVHGLSGESSFCNWYPRSIRSTYTCRDVCQMPMVHILVSNLCPEKPVSFVTPEATWNTIVKFVQWVFSACKYVDKSLGVLWTGLPFDARAPVHSFKLQHDSHSDYVRGKHWFPALGVHMGSYCHLIVLQIRILRFWHLSLSHVDNSPSRALTGPFPSCFYTTHVSLVLHPVRYDTALVLPKVRYSLARIMIISLYTWSMLLFFHFHPFG